jgi:hypothetical protein
MDQYKDYYPIHHFRFLWLYHLLMFHLNVVFYRWIRRYSRKKIFELEKKIILLFLLFLMIVLNLDFHHLFLNKNILIIHLHHAIHWNFSNRKIQNISFLIEINFTR